MFMANKKAMVIPPSRKHTPKRLTIWVSESQAHSMKQSAKNQGMIFSSYLENVLKRGYEAMPK